MYIGSASDHGQVYAPLSGKGEAAPAASSVPTGAVVSSEAAPFINPAVNFDYKAGIAVVVIRDGETGEVKAQYPSQKVVEEYIRHGAARQDAPSAEAPAPAVSDGEAAPAVDPATQTSAASAVVAAPAPVRADQVA